jgi:hypothetical protein
VGAILIFFISPSKKETFSEEILSSSSQSMHLRLARNILVGEMGIDEIAVPLCPM